MTLGAQPSWSDNHGQFIAYDAARCITTNAEVYSVRSPIIIIVDRCPEAVSVTDGILNDGNSQLPDLTAMPSEAPTRPNVLVFSRRQFACLVEYWAEQPGDLEELLIPEDPCG